MSIFNELQGQAEVHNGAVRLSHLPHTIERKGWPWTEQSAPIPGCLPDGNSWPRITVVVPSFRQAKFLEETLRSILLQGYPNLECMVIDGGSTDGSVDIIEAYAPFLSYWISEP